MRSFSSVLLLLAVITSTQAKTQTSVALQAVPSSATLGELVTLTAYVTPAGATGVVTFYDGAALLGSAVASNGSAMLTTTAIGYGKRSLMALYGGDANDAASLSAAFAENITTR